MVKVKGMMMDREEMVGVRFALSNWEDYKNPEDGSYYDEVAYQAQKAIDALSAALAAMPSELAGWAWEVRMLKNAPWEKRVSAWKPKITKNVRNIRPVYTTPSTTSEHQELAEHISELKTKHAINEALMGMEPNTQDEEVEERVMVQRILDWADRQIVQFDGADMQVPAEIRAIYDASRALKAQEE